MTITFFFLLFLPFTFCWNGKGQLQFSQGPRPQCMRSYLVASISHGLVIFKVISVRCLNVYDYYFFYRLWTEKRTQRELSRRTVDARTQNSSTDPTFENQRGLEDHCQSKRASKEGEESWRMKEGRCKEEKGGWMRGTREQEKRVRKRRKK